MPEESPEEMVRRLACKSSLFTSATRQLGDKADTVVAADGEVLGNRGDTTMQYV